METTKKICTHLPETIKNILLISEGWLVGSAVKHIIYGEVPKDYDILIPSRELYQIVCTTLRDYEYKINTFGGLKFKINGLEVDIWVEELGHFITTASAFDYAYNLRRSKLIRNNQQLA